jgi:2-polyprenyl-6-methoxyphenol hydroxylase-like FAD-dependent oxidoreductase
MAMNKVDVIIIGGSAAGAPTAMLLARTGLKVLLVEKRQFPRDTLSTHFIWARGVSYLKRWGLAETILNETPHFTELDFSIEGVHLSGSIPLADIEQRFIKLHGDSTGVTNICCGPRRYFLDQVLLDAARDAGVEVHEGTEFSQPLVEEGIITGIEAVRKDNTKVCIKARLVIGADGRFSNFAKQVGSEFTTQRELSSFAYWGYFPRTVNVRQAIHKKGRLAAAIYPTNADNYMALVYGPNSWWPEFRQDAENNFFKIFSFCAPEAEEAIRSVKRSEPFKSCGAMPAFHRQSWGRGWALIGDAGAFHDQATAAGETHAFRDAELIAGFIQKAFAGAMTMDEALTNYSVVREADYNPYFEFSCRTAEMNAYSAQEIAYFHSIRNNQQQVDQLISQVSDTLPFTEGVPFDGVTDEGLPDVLAAFQARVEGYAANPFEQNDVVLAESIEQIA